MHAKGVVYADLCLYVFHDLLLIRWPSHDVQTNYVSSCSVYRMFFQIHTQLTLRSMYAFLARNIG